MNFPLFSNLSLRNRFLVAMGIVFIPLLVVGIGSAVFLQHAAEALNQVVEQPVYKLQKTFQLQNQIRGTIALLEDHAGAPGEDLRNDFETASKTVEEMFIEILSTPTFGPAEYSLLVQSREGWQNSLVLANLIFSSGSSKSTLNQLGMQKNQIMFSLNQLYSGYYGEIGVQRTQIIKAEDRFLLIILVAISFGLISAIIGAAWIARSVLVPLREFEKGMAHFANDNLSYRLDLDNQDELGQLAREFNTMAERLMQHQNKLEELSIRDGLTGVYNRREFEKRLREETQRARRYSDNFSIMLLDIDHFKKVNDRYGHQAGDEALITVVDLIQLNVRPVDVVCRYGGEELAVILPQTEINGARIVAERIRSHIAESLTTTRGGDTIQITVSIGLAEFPQDGDTGPALVGGADRALYSAKQDGRNRVRSCISPAVDAFPDSRSRP